MKNQPEAPQAPDYAAANEAGVQADINALPLRNAINAATTLGTSYTDPNSGKTYDFTGLGSQDIAHAQLMQQLADAPETAKAVLDIQNTLGKGFAQSARDQLAITDPTGFALRDKFGGQLSNNDQSIESLVNGTQKFDPEAYLAKYPDLQKATEGMDQATRDAWATKHWQQNGQAEGRESGTPKQGGQPNAPTLESYQGNGPELSRMSDAPKLADTGQAQVGRGALESQIFDELSRVGQADPALQRQAEQAARARGASTGNILGDSSALQESLGVQLAQRDLDTKRQSDALNLLQSGQTTSDKNNALSQQNFQNAGMVNDQHNQVANQAFQNAMNAIGQRNTALQQSFGNSQGLLNQQIAARQQDTANKQSFLGLTPIVSQGAQLAGLQQGAAPTTSGTGYNAVGTAQNAGQLGSAFAGNIFGTQANIFNTQSQAATAGNGQMAGLATSFLCHVARLVYGEDCGKWVVFYHWKEYAAPKWFKSLYNRFAPQLANVLRYSRTAQNAVRNWMDARIQLSPV